LISAELRTREISAQIAQKVAKYHLLNMPGKREPILLETFQEWYDRANDVGVDLSKYIEPFTHCYQTISQSNSPIIFWFVLN